MRKYIEINFQPEFFYLQCAMCKETQKQRNQMDTERPISYWIISNAELRT